MSKKMRLWRKFSFASYMIATITLFIVLLLPLPSTVSKSIDLPYKTQYIQDSSIELGDSQTRQPGNNGQGLEQHKVVKPIFAYVFGADIKYSTTDMPTQTTEPPANQIIAQGTKKYQYMWCSDSSYRYYTNDQFKSPDVGFTHKSADYCAKNGEGHMTGLADTAPPQQTTRTVYAPSYTPDYIQMPTYTTCNAFSFTDEFSCTTY